MAKTKTWPARVRELSELDELEELFDVEATERVRK